MAVFKEMGAFFNKIEKTFTQMGKGLGNIFTGLFVDGPQGLGEGLAKGFEDIGVLLKWGSEYMFSNLICWMHFMKNINKCFIYYLFDVIKQIAYLPITFIKWLCWELTSLDLTEYENYIWGGIYYVDNDFKRLTGFHMFQYDIDVRNDCYNCKRLKVLAVKKKSQQINYDFMERMPALLNKGGAKMKQGGDEFKSAFE